MMCLNPVKFQMEVRIYKSLEDRSLGMFLFCARVSVLDSLLFEKSIDFFRSIYGSDIIIEFLVV